MEIDIDFRRDLEGGADVVFDEILFLADDDGGHRIGAPLVDGASAKGVVQDHVKDKKIQVVHFRRRKASKNQQGHRQKRTRVLIQEIA